MSTEEPTTTPSRQRVLVIDDEASVCLSCERILRSEGHEVVCRQDPREGLKDALSSDHDLILLDLVMPELDGLELLRQIKAAGVTSEVIIITGYSTVQTAVSAMKLGATDFVSKPFTPDELMVVVQKVIERRALVRENVELRGQLAERAGFEGMIAESRIMEQVFALIRRVAPTQSTVLITGESGTGKEMVARSIHHLSPRATHPFVACDCSALAPGLLESELFGHLRGAFSGAVGTKQGLFEVANRGTLFLDEISNISAEIQGKLLRALESRQVRRVGDTALREVDIRLVTATNRDLLEMVKAGTFREDLFYRLNVVPINLPPLRGRKGDIPLLAMTLLARLQARSPIRVKGFTAEAMRLLEEYAWPGNVRELKNIIERMAVLCESDRIEAHDLPPELQEHQPLATTTVVLPATWDEFKDLKRHVRDAATHELERRFLLQALERAAWNVTKASEAVGMQRTNFHALMSKHGLASSEG
jgi:DNA-binding NtrC family response regulator